MSCQSDPISNEVMIGIVIYRYNNKTKWELNGKSCRTGYAFVVNVDKLANIETERGSNHSKAWKCLFGSDMEDEEHWEIVGSGFALEDGRYKYNSGTFNEGKYTKDHFHDGNVAMNKLEQTAIRHALDNWKLGIQNTHVKDMTF